MNNWRIGLHYIFPTLLWCKIYKKQKTLLILIDYLLDDFLEVVVLIRKVDGHLILPFNLGVQIVSAIRMKVFDLILRANAEHDFFFMRGAHGLIDGVEVERVCELHQHGDIDVVVDIVRINRDGGEPFR